MIYQDVEYATIKEPTYVKCDPFVGEDGIYMPCEEYVPDYCNPLYRMVLSKEMFVEAYNKWIKGEEND